MGNARTLGTRLISVQSAEAALEADILRAKVVKNYVDGTTSNLAYLVFSRWAGRHVVVVRGRDEL